jgi:hypothetical protein
MTPTCPDLRTLAGDVYRVWNELEQRKAHVADDAWDLILRGGGGFVAPLGPGKLVVATRSWATTKKVLAAVKGARVVADGSDGQNVVIPAGGLEAVAGLLYLRRRRRLSPERRAAETARLAPYRMKKPRVP